MIRPATHAGTWYEGNPAKLGKQIDEWLRNAKPSVGTFQLRYAIGPHAGYRFCGDVLAYTYSHALDANVKKVILMGPSHFKYFKGIQTTSFQELSTPIGSLVVDRGVVSRLESDAGVVELDTETDLKEHSWEMHLPFMAKVAPGCRVIPLLFGAFDKAQTKAVLKVLSDVTKDPGTRVIVSSDFCHWGSYFDFTPFRSQAPLIYKHIEALDHEGIAILTAGKSSDEWADYIRRTGNTVCGATPIRALLMLAELQGQSIRFKELSYNQSSKVRSPEDSSVSYAALAG